MWKGTGIAILVLVGLAILMWLWFWKEQGKQGETTFQAQPPAGVGVLKPQKQKMMGGPALQ